MISLMYSLRMFNDSGSILVYAIKGPKLTECQHLALGQYRNDEAEAKVGDQKQEGEIRRNIGEWKRRRGHTEQPQQMLRPVNLTHGPIWIIPLLLNILCPLESIQQIVAKGFIKVKCHTCNDLAQ